MELQVIQKKIYTIRNQRVMLDFDLAELYETETKRLKQSVKRNIYRFPADFMFQLAQAEFANLRSQFVTSSWGGSRYPPFAFTEQGVAMLASVLNSRKAIEVNITIVRAFIALRQFLLNYKELEGQIKELYQVTKGHAERFKDVYEVLNELVKEKQEVKDWKDRNLIGFKR